ncbi:MAG: MoaD/ThiS family protein [Pseudomonadales bacterium]|nr:MoaD/ThiS family protein [Pseudomonadales bacterium]
MIADHLLVYTGGQHVVELPAASFRELLEALDERWPGAREAFARCAVAIDGQIYQDAYLEPIGKDSEVFFMQRIEGG